jgi:eukaryotic-like serine/threonine-protein kinase
MNQRQAAQAIAAAFAALADLIGLEEEGGDLSTESLASKARAIVDRHLERARQLIREESEQSDWSSRDAQLVDDSIRLTMWETLGAVEKDELNGHLASIIRAELSSPRRQRSSRGTLQRRPAYAAGSLVGRYQLVEKLATGGMAEVFLARFEWARGLEKTVVVKRILHHLAEDPAFIEMFFTEAQLAAQLSHPNIAQIIEFGESEGTYYLAMEHVDGLSLRALANAAHAADTGIPFPQCARIAAFCCEALTHAHELKDAATGQPLNLVHRDVSPDNVLISKAGSVKLVDFGIAKAATQGSQTKTRLIEGKLAYMAPEQLRAEPLDHRADIWALGVVLYELVTGFKPFGASGEVALVHSMLYEEAVPVRTRRQDVPKELEQIINRALERDRDRRYTDCRAMHADLEGYLLSAQQSVSALQIAQLVKQYCLMPGSAEGGSKAAAMVTPYWESMAARTPEPWRAQRTPGPSVPVEFFMHPKTGTDGDAVLSLPPNERAGPFAVAREAAAEFPAPLPFHPTFPESSVSSLFLAEPIASEIAVEHDPGAESDRDLAGIGRYESVRKVVTSGGSLESQDNATVAGLIPGALVQQYELIREIGGRGTGKVFLARDMKLGRRVAIKFLQTADAEHTQRFILEARTIARCNHENIVIIHDVGEHEGVPYMVLEYLEGHPLKALVTGQRVPAARAVELIAPVVRALACAHERSIVHRDLKPDNILVTDSGSIKVVDFGIAKVLQSAEQAISPDEYPAGAVSLLGGDQITRQGAILGTLPYMAPEQWNGADLDHRVDIWAVGIILFQLLAGRHPLAPLQGLQLVITRELEIALPSLQEAAPEVPSELASVVDRCLRKRREERFSDAMALMRALEPFLPGRGSQELGIEEIPYAGLSSFQESDANRFFGRTREITALVNRLHDRPVMAVVGPSGAGKSSFIRAGVVPVLKRSGLSWDAIIIRPGRDPLGALAATVAPFVITSTTLEDEIQEQRRLVERLRAEPGYVGTVLRSHARRQSCNVLLFVDQAEELYTLVPNPADRLAFTACLAGIADDATAPTRVIISLRSDLLDRVSEDEFLMAEVTQGLFVLSPPYKEGLRDALVQPAEIAGYRFETPELVERMLQHLQSVHGALPLLQFAATRLWEARDPARKLLTDRAYTDMGGVAGALATHADSVLKGLSSAEQKLVRALLLRLVTAERRRAIVSVEDLGDLSSDVGEMQRLMHQLIQARLLVIQTGAGRSGATLEIAHESLIHSWPTLRWWLDESQEDATFLEQLRTASWRWQAMGKDHGLLWRGDMVEEAQRFRRRYRSELVRVELSFLDAVLANAARAVQIRRAILSGVAVLLVLMVVAAGVALGLINAEKEAIATLGKAQQAEAETRSHREKAEQLWEEANGPLTVAEERQNKASLMKYEALTGTLEVTSNVPGLVVKVGKRKGELAQGRPFRTSLPPGQYDVELSDPATGYWVKRWKVEIKVNTPLKLDGQVVTGGVRLSSPTTGDAAVYVDQDRQPRATAPVRIELNEGLHRIRFETPRRPGGHEQEIVVEPGKDVSVIAKYD